MSKALAQIVNYNAEDDGTFHVELKIACGVERASGVIKGPYNPASTAPVINLAIKNAVRDYCSDEWNESVSLLNTTLLGGVVLV